MFGTEVNLDNLFESEGTLTDSPQSESILENDMIYNSECIGFSISFSSHCITCIFKPTKRSKYVYFLLLYNERDTSPNQYTKNINGTASLVDAIEKYKRDTCVTLQGITEYSLLLVHVKVVDRNE